VETSAQKLSKKEDYSKIVDEQMPVWEAQAKSGVCVCVYVCVCL
jgi:hypothetical protein